MCQIGADLTCAACQRPVCDRHAKGQMCKYCGVISSIGKDEVEQQSDQQVTADPERPQKPKLKELTPAHYRYFWAKHRMKIIVATLAIGVALYIISAVNPDESAKRRQVQQTSMSDIQSTQSIQQRKIPGEVSDSSIRQSSNLEDTRSWEILDFGTGVIKYPKETCNLDVGAAAIVCLKNPQLEDIVFTIETYKQSDDILFFCGSFRDCVRNWVWASDHTEKTMNGFRFVEGRNEGGGKVVMLDIKKGVLVIHNNDFTSYGNKIFETILSTIQWK